MTGLFLGVGDVGSLTDVATLFVAVVVLQQVRTQQDSGHAVVTALAEWSEAVSRRLDLDHAPDADLVRAELDVPERDSAAFLDERPTRHVATDGGRPRPRPRGLLQRLIALLRARDAPTEEQSPTDGLFSHAGEVHAAIIGAGIGLVAGVLGQPVLAAAGISLALGLGLGIEKRLQLTGRFAAQEMRREPWYGSGGVLAGFFVLTPLAHVLVDVLGVLPN